MLSIILRFHVSHLSSKISRKGQKTTFCKTGQWPERHRKIHFSHTFRRRRQQWLNLSRLILLENKLVFLCTNLNYSSWEIAWQRLDFLQQFSKMGDAITRLRWPSVSDHVPTFCPKSLISVGRPGIEKKLKISQVRQIVSVVSRYFDYIAHKHNLTFFAFAVLRATY